jgi:hypothetical protein
MIAREPAVGRGAGVEARKLLDLVRDDAMMATDRAPAAVRRWLASGSGGFLFRREIAQPPTWTRFGRA